MVGFLGTEPVTIRGAAGGKPARFDCVCERAGAWARAGAAAWSVRVLAARSPPRRSSARFSVVQQKLRAVEEDPEDIAQGRLDIALGTSFLEVACESLGLVGTG